VKRGIRLLPPETDLEVAEEIRRCDDPHDYAQSLLSDSEVDNVKVPPQQFILRDFIKKESINLINGFRGCGKSWLALAIANGVTWGEAVGPWESVEAVNTLYVDGEMTFSMLQDRLRMLNVGRSVKSKPRSLFLYPESYAYRIGLERASILKPRWREFILEQSDLLKIELLVLDNLSSLAPGLDENIKMDFDPVNKWLLELRYSGVTTIMLHHTGKRGDQRGTSAHEDHVDVSILLSTPPNHSPQEGCKFIWKPIKDRAHATGDITYIMQLTEDPAGRYHLSYGGIDLLVKDTTKVKEAVALLHANPNLTRKEAYELGISKMSYYRAKDILSSFQPS